jgi:YebC/PmpR family DNA-binding regulatory protein
MSGHSKWSQIKHKKALVDAKKGKIFGKLARAIAIAARGNPDPTTNLRLRGEVERARSVNMPNDNIERAINRVGDKDAAALSEVQLELIGPGNAAIIVSAITDNSNRTINELKQLVLKHHAHMAGQGAVAWMFKKVGILRLSEDSGEDAQLLAIDAGADDVVTEDGSLVVYTSPETFHAVRSALGASVTSADMELIATTPVVLPDDATRNQLLALLEALDEHDDVQDVVTNANLS